MKFDLKRFFKNIVTGLAFGMKATEEQILTQKGSSHDTSSGVIKEMDEHRVSKALLKGEVTQEVKELRYRTYKVTRESNNLEYMSPTLTLKKDEEYRQNNKFINYENSLNLPLVTIQVNNVYNNIENYTQKDKEKIEHTLKFKQSFIPRYKLENYITRVVILNAKDENDKDRVYLDFYTSIYPNKYNFKSILFLNEIKKIKDKGLRSDIIDIDNMSFVTCKAYDKPDMLEYEFNNIFFNSILEYDGSYILRFKAHMKKNGVDLTDRFYCKEMDEKYKNNAKKEVNFNFSGQETIKTYVCEECGKVVTYDTSKMDEMKIEKPRYVDEEKEDSNSNITEYLDFQIICNTIGKNLCKDCMKKYIEENKDKLFYNEQ